MKARCRSKDRSAVTFIELLIVVTIFSLLSMALYGTFASGMRMWGRVNENTLTQRRVILRLEKFAQELREALNFAQIGFVGEEDSVSFPILSSQGRITRVTYYFEKEDLLRKQEDYKDILEDKESETKPRSFLSGLKEVKFTYAYNEFGKEKYTWKDEWKKSDGIPAVIKIELKSKDATFGKSVVIPVS